MSDPVGALTLERMAAAAAYNRWMWDRLEPWVGDRVVEVGSGVGNMSQFLVGRERALLTDPETGYLDALAERFGHLPGVGVRELRLPDVPEELAAERLDTVVCLNVLEHVTEDAAALSAMGRVLAPGGRLVLLVPAHRWLYGTLDRALGHERRYSGAMLEDRIRDAGLRLRHLEPFNLAGVPGWLVTGRVLRRELIPEGPLSAYDALVPLFRLERLLPWRTGQSLIAIAERP